MTREVFQHLQAKYKYVGKATYSRTVSVPKSWRKGRVVLHLDRVLWTSQVRVNGQALDKTCESLSTPHEFDITSLVQFDKDNTLDITIDNSKKLCRITLDVKPQSYIRRVAVYPQAKSGMMHVRIDIAGTDKPNGKLRFAVVSPHGNDVKDTTLTVKNGAVEFDTHVAGAKPWDEFAPNV